DSAAMRTPAGMGGGREARCWRARGAMILGRSDGGDGNSKCLRVPRHARIAGGKVKGMGIAFNGARPLFPMAEHRAVIMPNPPRLRASHGGGKRRGGIVFV